MSRRRAIVNGSKVLMSWQLVAVEDRRRTCSDGTKKGPKGFSTRARVFCGRSEKGASQVGRGWTMTEQRELDLRAALTSLISTVLTHPENAMEAFAGWSRDHGRPPEATVNGEGDTTT